MLKPYIVRTDGLRRLLQRAKLAGAKAIEIGLAAKPFDLRGGARARIPGKWFDCRTGLALGCRVWVDNDAQEFGW